MTVKALAFYGISGRDVCVSSLKKKQWLVQCVWVLPRMSQHIPIVKHGISLSWHLVVSKKTQKPCVIKESVGFFPPIIIFRII